MGMKLITRLIETALFQRTQSLFIHIVSRFQHTCETVPRGLITPTVSAKTTPSHSVSEERLRVLGCQQGPSTVDKAVFDTLLKSRTEHAKKQTSPPRF